MVISCGVVSRKFEWDQISIICTWLLWSDDPAFRESKFWRSRCAASTKKGFDMALCNHICILELQDVSFQKLDLPHDDIGKSLCTFLKGGYIFEALLSNKNPNIWGWFFNFKKYCIATVKKLDRMKECNRCHNWFHEVCEDCNCEDQIKFIEEQILQSKLTVNTHTFAATESAFTNFLMK